MKRSLQSIQTIMCISNDKYTDDSLDVVIKLYWVTISQTLAFFLRFCYATQIRHALCHIYYYYHCIHEQSSSLIVNLFLKSVSKCDYAKIRSWTKYVYWREWEVTALRRCYGKSFNQWSNPRASYLIYKIEIIRVSETNHFIVYSITMHRDNMTLRNF